MSLTIAKCRQCGATADGTFCSTHCEQDYINEQDAKQAFDAKAELAKRDAARKRFFAALNHGSAK